MAIVYLLGLFIGAIDTGIITPARPIIQNELGVDANLGIWMITIYTLTYAAIIPISGKLADLKGRKPVYLLSIAMFGIGSCICASAAMVDSFLVLMIGRIVQASGAGGIMPVATAEFATSITSKNVWPFLVISIVLLPLFVIVERRAEDPIFHIEYVGNRQIMITLALGVVVGCSMMGMIFIPQFAENALKIAAGSGGYFVIILGFCAGGASMMSGKLIDKRGAKL